MYYDASSIVWVIRINITMTKFSHYFMKRYLPNVCVSQRKSGRLTVMPDESNCVRCETQALSVIILEFRPGVDFESRMFS